ncbi:MAG TPA: hypothetical protein V6D08_03520 [Candidatus Obscuribacterales bacterium]
MDEQLKELVKERLFYKLDLLVRVAIGLLIGAFFGACVGGLLAFAIRPELGATVSGGAILCALGGAGLGALLATMVKNGTERT